jgi:MATE family multidrug resistance protein
MGCGLAYYVAVSMLSAVRRFAPYGGVRSIARWGGSMLRLSAPIVLQRVISYGSWFGFFFVVSRIGTSELAATNVIRQLYSLPITVASGLGVATATLVGQNLGARRPDDAERIGWEGARLAAYGMGAIGLLFLAIPEPLLRIYTSEPSVLAAGRAPLFYLGLVQAFAGTALVLSQALQGAGDTRFVLRAELFVCGGAYLPLVFLLGLRTPLGLSGAWMGEYLYWVILTVVMALKFREKGWKRIAV